MSRFTSCLATLLSAGLLGSLALVIWQAWGADSTQEPTEVEIYRKEMKQIGDLVISRGPDRPVSEWAVLLPEGARLEDYSNCFSVRIELHLENATPITLASLLRRDLKEQGGYEVLDALFHKGAFVIATIDNGSIVLTRIDPFHYEPVVSSRLPQRVWSKAAGRSAGPHHGQR